MPDYNINVNLPKDEVTRLAKQTIKEIVQQNINEVMNQLNVKSLIEKELNFISEKVKKEVGFAVKKKIESDRWNIINTYKEEAKKVVLDEIQKNPLSGNVYLKISKSEYDTDYD